MIDPITAMPLSSNLTSSVVPGSGFVGRTAELHALTSALGSAIGGQGRAVLVSGEGGVGKTRLCEEVARIAPGLGAHVVWMACWESSGLPPFTPWAQMLGQLGEVFNPGLERDTDPRVGSWRLYAQVSGMLQRAASRQPLLLVVDDLHWADAGSLRLLTHIAPAVRTMPVLLVATMRETGIGSSMPADLVRHCLAVPLEGLSTDEVRQLAGEMTGSAPSTEVATALHRATRGNPLFACELVRRLGRDGGLQQLMGVGAIPVSPTIRAVLDARLAELGPATRDVLGVASVIGGQFTPSFVAAVSGESTNAVLTAFDEAVAAAVVSETGRGVYAFSHPLIRSVLHDDVGVARRIDLHRRAGEALESTGSSDAATLSFHFLAAAPSGTTGKAVHFAQVAARAALDALAYEEAAALYDQALTADEIDPGHADRVTLLLGAGEARTAAGDTTGAREAFLRAAADARRTHRMPELAGAALGLSGTGFEVALFDRDQVELLEKAYAGLGDEDPGLRARVAARLSVALSLSAETDRRVALSNEAVDLALETLDADAIAQALAARCDVRAGPEHRGDRAADAAKIVRRARLRRDLGTELLGRRLAVVAAMEGGDMPALDAEIHGFARVADSLAQPQYEWYVLLWQGARAVMCGRIEEYERLVTAAEALGREAGSVNSEILTMTQRWFAAQELGDLAAACRVVDERVPAGRYAEMGPQMLPLEVGRRAFVGHTEEGRAVLESGMSALMKAPRDAEWLTMVAQVAVLAVELGLHEGLPWMYDALRPFAGVWAVDGIGAYVHGPVHRQLGLIAAAVGRREVAAAHFDAALAANQRAGAELLVARTLLDRARALDDAAAMAEARARYESLGAEKRVAEIDRQDGAPAPSARSVFRREGEVWHVEFAGAVLRVRDSKGMRDLAALLVRPGREVAATDLMQPDGLTIAGDLGPAVDEVARDAYRQRLADLEGELDAADSAGDSAASTRLAAERDTLLEQLRGAYGLGGRARKVGGTAERARTAVTARIRDAIRRIDAAHPALGRHLSRSVRTGTFCSYDPEERVTWEV